jgi:Fe-S oxidoreductase
MALQDYKQDMETCCRCSACKFVPLETLKGYDHVNACPAIARYNYRAYSGGGKLGIGMGLLDGVLDYSSSKLREIAYNCQLCGACDTSCKYAMDMEVLDPLTEIRAELVRHGNTNPVLDKLVSTMKNDGPMLRSTNVARGQWAKNLEVKDYTKERSEVAYYAGCRTACDQSKWPVAQKTIQLMRKAGIDVGIAPQETCCGTRAYQMGYQEEAINQAKRNAAALKQAGIKTLVCSCAECYFAFKVLYDKLDLKHDLEVLHTSEYFLGLLRQGKLKPTKTVDMTVTYHDPCHLGRQGEPYIQWKGERVPGQIILFNPAKTFRRGTHGVYDAPRQLLQSIPGIKVVEMARHKEFAWCCGAGGGVSETNSEFAKWTAAERVREAAESSPDGLVTACPGCETLLGGAAQADGNAMQVYDIVEVLAQSVL